jgi:hypothetical protein
MTAKVVPLFSEKPLHTTDVAIIYLVDSCFVETAIILFVVKLAQGEMLYIGEVYKDETLILRPDDKYMDLACMDYTEENVEIMMSRVNHIAMAYYFGTVEA